MDGIIIEGEVKKEHSSRRKQGAKTESGVCGAKCVGKAQVQSRYEDR